MAPKLRRVLRAVDRLRGEHGGDGGEAQVRKAAIGRTRLDGPKPRPPANGGARDFEPDRDLGELGADYVLQRLCSDDRARPACAAARNPSAAS